ncbi:MAG: hypothetical protein ACRDFB_02545 [Rhabdochlamydiaceae bacterium]
MKKGVSAVMVGLIIFAGLFYAHPAYAHNFASDESANFIGKVANLKAEVQALQMDLSDPAAVSWHVSKINSYWTANDTTEMAERNQLLSTEIPNTINTIITAAKQPSPDSSTISTQITALNGYLDESIPVRIDQDKLQNATVQALADTDIIKEALADYGIAINSQVDLNDMSKMQGMGSMDMGQGNMSGMNMGTSYSQNEGSAIHLVQMSGMSSSGSMSGMSSNSNMSGMSGMSSSGNMSGMNMQSNGTTAVPISNMAAYHSAQTHAQAMKSFFDKNVAPLATASMSTPVQTADSYMGQLIDAINNKDDGNTIMVITHMHIHPALITAFNLPLMQMNMGGSAVPEFPVPTLLVLVSIIGVVAITRFRTKLN